MLIAILFILVISLGGIALTYLIEREQPMLWRFAAGTVIGQCVFATALFLVTFATGLNVASVVIATVLALSPLLLLKNGDSNSRFKHDWAKAKGRLAGGNWQKALPFLY